MPIPKIFLACFSALAISSMPCSLALSPDPNAAAWKQLDEDGKNVNFPAELMTRFGTDLIVDCDGFKIVDSDNLTLKPLIVPNVVSLRSVCEDDTKHCSYAYGRGAEGLVIKKRDLEGWHDIKVPAAISAEPHQTFIWQVCAD